MRELENARCFSEAVPVFPNGILSETRIGGGKGNGKNTRTPYRRSRARLSCLLYALPELNAPDGTPTNAIVGFLNMFQKILEEWTPSHVGIIFDAKDPRFVMKSMPSTKRDVLHSAGLFQATPVF
jgi:hypothetical protein